MSELIQKNGSNNMQKKITPLFPRLSQIGFGNKN